VITSKAAAEIWRGIEAAFVGLRPHGYDADLLTALAGQGVPSAVIAAFRSNFWVAQETFFKFGNGRWFADADSTVAAQVMRELGETSEVEAGQELLRRFANATRSEYLRRAGPLNDSQLIFAYFKNAGPPVSGAMFASGYKWENGEFVKEMASGVAAVPPVAAVVALVQRAQFGKQAEELLVQMLELADAGLAANDLQGWTTATAKARDALGLIVTNASARVGAPTPKQAEARQNLVKVGLLTAEQEFRVQLIYKAVCETAHKITSREDAVLDVAVSLTAGEFLLRKLLGHRP
jgi:hypothetical protein